MPILKMRKIALSLVFLTAPVLALAQSATVPSWDLTTKFTIDRAMTVHETDEHGVSVETFRMEEGGCLRGPIVFTGTDGKEIFRLLPGIEYPTNCGNPKG